MKPSTYKKSLKNQLVRMSGFTLVELMIVVAIIGILASIAYPSYANYVREGYRAQAQEFLANVATKQEQYLSDARAYTTTLGATGLNLSLPAGLTQKYSAPVITVDNAAIPPTFTLTMTAINAQSDDGNLIIDSDGNSYRDIDKDGAYTAGTDKRFDQR